MVAERAPLAYGFAMGGQERRSGTTGMAPLWDALRCVGCGAAALQQTGAELECTRCGRNYPIRADIAVMVTDAVAERGPLMETAPARALLDSLGAKDDSINTLLLRRASGAVIAKAAHPIDPDGQPSCEWLGDYVPRSMPPGEELLANVRFRNKGTAPMRSVGDNRVTIAYAWTDAAGRRLAGNDTRTPLPVDLPPGQMLTLPVRLRTPVLAGHYTLTLQMVEEGVQWLEPLWGPIPVRIRHGAGFVPPADWVLDGPGSHDPAEDRERGAALLQDWLTAHAPPNPVVLEIGGGSIPMMARLGGEAFQADQDLLALQAGAILRRAGPNPIRPVFADPLALPFPQGFFDAIVFAGTLRYQAEPARLLRSLCLHLKPGGFIALICEPVGQMWPGTANPTLLAELRAGANPQGFKLGEWGEIFGAARLRPNHLIIDGASLKARLQPEHIAENNHG
jgi:SAM-dependent methyltransferase/uncharacterized protein YbaR (Trm112 family)